MHGAQYRLSDIWADTDEIEGTIRTIELNYPSLRSKIFVITEGPYDYEFYSACLDKKKCVVRIANSRDNVRTVIRDIMERVPENAKHSVIGIVDRDFFIFGEDEESLPNLFTTDTHDIETMMFASPTLECVVDYFADLAGPGTFEQKIAGDIRGSDLRAALVDAARYLGLAVFINNSCGFHVSFKHINCKKKDTFSRFIDDQTLRCDLAVLKSVILEKNPEKGVVFLEEFDRVISDNPRYFDYPWHICRGHDLMCVLLRDLNYRFPRKDGGVLNGRDLERVFREMYRPEYFCDTELYAKLRAWEHDFCSDPEGGIFSGAINSHVR